MNACFSAATGEDAQAVSRVMLCVASPLFYVNKHECRENDQLFSRLVGKLGKIESNKVLIFVEEVDRISNVHYQYS